MMGQVFGSYQVLEKLGEGGMGQVYRARDLKLQRDVALKVLPDAFARDSGRRARFEREAHVLAALNHPQIAAIYGVAENQGVSALVLELVEGPTLEERLADGALPLEEAAAIARQVAEALEKPPTKPASSIATSNPPTSSCGPTARCRCSISDWRRRSRATTPSRLNARTCRQQSPMPLRRG